MVRKHSRRSGRGRRRSRPSSPTKEEEAKQPRTPPNFGQSAASEDFHDIICTGGVDPNMFSLPDPASFKLADGIPDIFDSWHFFSEEEMIQIVDINSFEVISNILGIQGTPSEKEIEIINGISKDLGVDDLIEDGALMASLCSLFIEMLKNKQRTISEGTQLPPIAVAVFQVWNEHLLQVHALHTLLAQFLLFLLWWISSSDAGWFSRLSTLTLFGDDADLSRSEDKLKSFLSAMAISNMSFWWPQRVFMVFLSLIPFGLLSLNQTLESKGSQVAGLRPICKCLLLAAQLAVIYFAWYSWSQLCFCLAFFFPSLMRFLSIGLCVLISFVLDLIRRIRSSALSLPAQSYFASRSWGIYFSLMCMCLLYWRSLFSTWPFLLVFSILLFIMPAFLLGVSLELSSVILPHFFERINALLAVRFIVFILVNLFFYSIIYFLEYLRSRIER